MVYLFITKTKTVEHYADKEEAQRLFGYGEPDMVITEKQYDEAEGIFRLIDGKIFLGKTKEEKREELSMEKRSVRDTYLKGTDKYVLPDFPITPEQKEKVLAYRKELRDLPEQKNFPNVDIPKLTL